MVATCGGRSQDETVVSAFERQVRTTPLGVAIRFRDVAVTFGELDARANRLARWLRTLGVGEEDLVGVFMERSVELVVALLAVLRAQAAFVPLDPDYPPARISDMVEDAGMRIVVTQPHLLDRIRLPGVDVLDVLSTLNQTSVLDAPVDPKPVPTALAYMMYTSGSTGRPKGVLIEHRALFNRLSWGQDTFALGPDDVVLQKTPFSFDVAMWELFWPLMCGACLVLADPGAHRDPDALAATIRQHGVTVIHFVPSMLDIFLGCDVGPLPTLRLVFSSGEALSPATLSNFYERMGAALHNLYGPTEAAIEVSHWPCTPADGSGPVPIGRPIANVQLHVLDNSGAPVPPGRPGELHIGGVCLARGYHRREELTRERFVADPFTRRAGARLYRTGDIARVRPDGAIEYLGRLDDQIKVRGARVELGEVEASLRRAASCPQVAVRPAVAPSGATVLVGYHCGDEVEPRTLGRRVAALLPRHMVPAAFVRLDRLPLTPSGKLDRNALPLPSGHVEPGAAAAAPAGGRPRLSQPGRHGLTVAEAAVVQAFEEILGVDHVALIDDFFELGGDSFLAVALTVALADHAEHQLEVRDVFEAPTPIALAERLEGAPSVLTVGPPPMARTSGDSTTPISPTQRAVLDGPAAQSSHPLHHLALAVRMTGRLDLTEVSWAWRAVVARHGALRTGFHREGSQWCQAVHGEVPADPILREVGRDLPAEIVRPFDLLVPPLARLVVTNLATDDHMLLFVAHRSVADEWSLQLLLRDFSRFYFHRVDGCELPAGLDLGYADYCKWYQAARHTAAFATLDTFWDQTLDHPEDRTNAGPSDARTFTTLTLEGDLDESTMRSVRAAARRADVGLPTVLLAGLHLVLRERTGGRSTVVGIPDSGRRGTPDLDRVVGPFERLLPLCLRWPDNVSLDRCLADTRSAVMAARAHAIGYAGPRPATRGPAVVFRHTGTAALRPGTVALAPMELAGTLSDLDLRVETTEVNGTVRIGLQFGLDAFSPEDAGSMADRYASLLSELGRFAT